MNSIPPRERPLLRRIVESYTRMCHVRQVSEISSRNALGPLTEFRINDNGIKLQRGTHENQNIATRIFITALVDFASECFDEYASLSAEEQWAVIYNCYETILFLDGIYRAERDFPNNLKLYGHMTSLLDPEDVDDYFGDSTAHKAFVLQGLKMSLLEGSIHDRKVVQGISDEEFYAILGLVLWNTENCSLFERVVNIFEKQRRALLKDVHSYYASVKEDEYSVRIGRIFHAINTVKSGISDFRIGMETLRVLDVIGDDTFIWHLIRT